MISFILPAFLFLISTLLSISPGRNNFISISTAMAQSTPTISRILVSGNQKVEADAIKMELSQKEGETLDQEKVSGDIKKIFNMGFFKDVRVSLLTIDNGQKILTYIVEEKPSINKIEYVGNDELTEDDIKDVVDLKQFSILNILKLEENVKKIQTLYVEKGYFLAQVSYQIQDQTNNQVDIKFIVNEHAKVTIRNILFIGNKKVKDNTLKEFMLTKEGNLFSFLTSELNYKEEYLAADV